jgi:hypothetical protein
MRFIVPIAAITWPWGMARTIASPSPVGASLSPRSTARNASTFSGGHLLRLAIVRFLTMSPSR